MDNQSNSDFVDDLDDMLDRDFSDEPFREDTTEDVAEDDDDKSPVWVAPRRSLAWDIQYYIESWAEAVWEKLEWSIELTLWGVYWWLLFVKVLPPLWNMFEELFQ